MKKDAINNSNAFYTLIIHLQYAQKMKIQIISRPIAPPWDSGSMNMAYILASQLAEYGHQVIIPVVNNFTVNSSNLHAMPVYTSRQPNLLQKFLLLNSLGTRSNIDIFHYFLSPTLITKLAHNLFIKKRKVPSVLTITHIPKGNNLTQYFGDYIVTYSQAMANIARKSGATKVVTIPPAVDLDLLRMRAQSGGDEEYLNRLPTDHHIVLYAGELGQSQVINTIINAATTVVDKDKSIHFILACRNRTKADNHAKADLLKRLSTFKYRRHIHLLETIDNMPALISRSKVCILPIDNTFGKVDLPLFLIEAAALGKPVIVSDIPPMNEILQDPIGLSVPKFDSVSLAESICKLIKDGKPYGEHGIRIVEQRYNIKNICNQYLKIYQELCNERY